MRRTADCGLRTAAGLALALLGCSHSHTCSDLEGPWRDDSGARWMLLDHDGAIEGYPLFADEIWPRPEDRGPRPEVRGAPRALELHREGERLAGFVVRRYDHGPDSCVARAPVAAACGDDGLELGLADPAAPTSFAPCKWPPAPLAHVERWHRE